MTAFHTDPKPTRWVFPRQCLSDKASSKAALGRILRHFIGGLGVVCTAEGRAKMQRQAISLGVVAPVVLARRRVAATPAATSSRAPPADQKSHFLGRRPSHGASAPPPPSTAPPSWSTSLPRSSSWQEMPPRISRSRGSLPDTCRYVTLF